MIMYKMLINNDKITHNTRSFFCLSFTLNARETQTMFRHFVRSSRVTKFLRILVGRQTIHHTPSVI